MAQEYLLFRGTMHGHTDCVTAIAAPIDNSDIIVTASRDKSLIRWKLTKQEEEEKTFGVPACRFIGHSDSVEDVVISESGECALSASSDSELLLWDMEGEILCDFVGHTEGVLSVAFSPDDRQILSASRDKTIKLWNNLGDCKFTLQEGDAHSDCVSCVRFSPDTSHRTAVSCSWDNTVKVWDLNRCTLLCTLSGHSGRVNAVVVSPDGMLCASGGEDGLVLLWDPLMGRMIYSLRVGSTVNAMCFSPNRHWLCAATQSSIKIWDLESMSSVADLKVDLKQEIETADSADQATAGENEAIYCTSLTWKADGSILFCGYTDGVIRVWGVDGC